MPNNEITLVDLDDTLRIGETPVGKGVLRSAVVWLTRLSAKSLATLSAIVLADPVIRLKLTTKPSWSRMHRSDI